MSRKLPDQILSRFSGYLSDRIGLHFPAERWNDLERGILSAAREFGAVDTVAWVNSLIGSRPSRREIETLAGHLTVGETYFMREIKSLEALERRVLPELIAARSQEKSLRLWSAGCSTGEEAYSLAILLRQQLHDLRHWNVTLLATDINPRALGRAAAGIFREWSFRGTPDRIRRRYFMPHGPGLWKIVPEIQEMVAFAHLNLAEDIYPSLLTNTNAMDLIVCRNVLMYFAPEVTRNVVQRFNLAMAADGWLVLSPSEAHIPQDAPFEPVNLSGAILFRKKQTAPPSESSRQALPRARASGAGHTPQLPVKQAAVPSRSGAPPSASSLEKPRAVALFERGAYAEAATELERRIEASGATVEDAALLARCHANLGQLAIAREWCERAIALRRLDPGLHFLHAGIFEEQHEFEEAEQALKRVLYLEPDFPLAHFALGNLARQRRDWTAAERSFRRAVTLLARRDPGEVLPESEGVTAGRLREIVETTLHQQAAA